MRWKTVAQQTIRLVCYAAAGYRMATRSAPAPDPLPVPVVDHTGRIVQ